MHKLIIFATAAAALTLSACGANQGAALDALKVVVTDTNCSHDDKINIVTGAAGIAASVTASAERHCPVGGAASLAPKPAPLAVGALVGNTPPN